MVFTVEAKCLDFGNEFSIDQGGGFFVHQLRCESCGKTKSIGFEKLGELDLFTLYSETCYRSYVTTA